MLFRSQIGQWPDDLAGVQDVVRLAERGVETRCLQSGTRLVSGRIDVGKHLRPNYRDGRIVLFAEPAAEDSAAAWVAVRLK